MSSPMSSCSSASSSVRKYRLLQQDDETSTTSVQGRASKRFKTTGDDHAFVLRRLTLSDTIQTNDEVHVSIELCPVMKALVDTQVFQRLRNVVQLGTAQYLYACANHNRFQHSLGVAFLAEKMCAKIKADQPELGATDKDVLCVKLAGLLHDIGHGPYSHLYEEFRNNRLPKFLEEHPDLDHEYDDCKNLCIPDDWSHEESSLIMIDAALEELGLKIDMKNLDKPLKQIGDGVDAKSMRVFKPPGVNDCVLTSRDFVFIKECIYGKPLKESKGSFIGRQKEGQEWLYDIVNNRHNGLDVDKIDYFARDSGRTIGSRGIDIKMIDDARVARGKCSRPDKCPTCKELGFPRLHYMVCYPKKRVEASMSFFQRRIKLHSSVYQHKKTNAAACMILDILCLADPFLRLQSKTGEKFPISRAANRSDFLVRLDDSVLSLIEQSTDERLEEARALCTRLRKHDLYKCALDKPLQPYDNGPFDLEGEDRQCDEFVWNMSEHEIQAGIIHELKVWEETSNPNLLEAKDFVVEKYCMHHGGKTANPLGRMRFFDEMNEKLFGPIQDLPVADQVNEKDYTSVVPISLQKVGIRIYCRDASKRDTVNQFFHQWYERMRRGEVGEAEITDLMGSQEGNDNVAQYSAAVPLSQDDPEDDDSDDEGQKQYDLDRSPVPIRSR